MNKKENALSGAATPERANDRKDLRESNFSYLKDNTETNEFQAAIESLLHRGRENALTSFDLIKLTGCKSNRELQLRIAAERENGALILSSSSGSGGYYLPAAGEQGRQEILAFERTLHARAVHTLTALRPARQALRNFPGQVGLNDGAR